LFALAVAPATVFADGGGNVMPPTAKPHGYSLEDMNEILAKFDASYNDMRYYPPPPFPFQVLYMVSDAIQWQPTSCPDGGAGWLQTGSNYFNNVSSGTPFFVPVFSVNDIAPVIGVFPADKRQAPGYCFDSQQVGFRDLEVIVDGKSTSIGPEYVAGPSRPQTLLDGTMFRSIQIGVFLTPMSVGTHTVTIRGQAAGAALVPAYDTHCLQEDFTYVVRVVPGGKSGK
jgi:hypothetical protein